MPDNQDHTNKKRNKLGQNDRQKCYGSVTTEGKSELSKLGEFNIESLKL